MAVPRCSASCYKALRSLTKVQGNVTKLNRGHASLLKNSGFKSVEVSRFLQSARYSSLVFRNAGALTTFPTLRSPLISVMSLATIDSTAVAGAEGDDESANDEEPSRKKRKQFWPSPVNHPDDNKVFIGGEGMNTDIARIKEVMTQFGPVAGVNVPLLNRYRMYPTRDSYRFAFVVFSNKDAKEKAIASGSVFDADGKTIDIKVLQQKEKLPTKKLYVQGFSNVTSEQEIRQYFSQFGNVVNVDMIRLRNRNSRYAFVEFESVEEASAALKTEFHRIADSVLNVAESYSQRSPVGVSFLMVENLPSDITIPQMREYFDEFGTIKHINLIIRNNGSEGSQPNYAFIGFSTSSSMESLLREDGIHRIGDMDVHLKRASQKKMNVLRPLKVFVEGLTDSVSEEDLTSHFADIAPVNKVSLLKTRDTGELTGCALVEFASPEGAAEASAKLMQQVKDCEVRVRQLGFAGEK